MCWRKKRRSLVELSNNISERRCELKANEPVSERNERASEWVNYGFMTGSNEVRVSRKSEVYFISDISWDSDSSFSKTKTLNSCITF